jgi:hypothetical protein
MEGQYQIKTKVIAMIRQVKPMEFSKTNSKPKQSLFLEADNGEKEWVTLIGKFDPLDFNSEGKKFEFLLWPFKAEESPRTTLYCWINRQVATQQPQQGQNTPQTHQTPLQVTNTPQGKEIATLPPQDYRALALDIAGRLCAAGKYEYSAMFIEADVYVDYIKNGTHPFGLAGAVSEKKTEEPADEEWPEEPGSRG